MTPHSASQRYIVLGCKPWNRRVFDDVIRRYPGEWIYIGDREELTREHVDTFNPRYLFFLHWSWRVPADIFERCECVCFHMTDVPYGRGGSPLQNLILRGHTSTVLAALRMTAEYDAGPVYLKSDLGLAGTAEQIYSRSAQRSAEMIERIIREHPTPVPQTGDCVPFRRRTPEESQIPAASSPSQLYDFIRMLDADGYPRAFAQHNGYRYEFSNAELRDDRVTADVVITPLEECQS